MLFALFVLSLSRQCSAPCTMADLDQTQSAGLHWAENQKADAESPGSPGVLQAVAPAVQQGHAHSLQGVASPGVHAEGARRAIHPQSGGRETDPILSPSTLVATHGARRSDSFPATGSTLLFPQQDQTRSMPAAGAVINEDDFEPTLEVRRECHGRSRNGSKTTRRRVEARRGQWAGISDHAQEGCDTHHSRGCSRGCHPRISRGHGVPWSGTQSTCGRRRAISRSKVW